MAKQQSSSSATKGPAFEIRFCDDNRVQVFDLSGRRDPTAKQLPYEYHESEVLEGKLRYSKLIGYSPSPEDATVAQQHGGATIRPKVSRANQELLMQTSRYSRSCSLPEDVNDYKDMMMADDNADKSTTVLSSPSTTATVYQQPQAPQTPLPSRAYNAESLRQPAAVKAATHHSDYVQTSVLIPSSSSTTTTTTTKPAPTAASQGQSAIAPPPPSSRHQYQQSSSNMYSIAPSMTSTTMVVDEKHMADNEYLYSQNERQKEKAAGCCCVIS